MPLYNLFINLMVFGMKIFSFFHAKTKRGVDGRKQSLSIVKSAFSETDEVLWMHAASLGEYEQGLPVLEKLKEKHHGYKILITFFSPSGYDYLVKKNHIADAVCYLPFDRKSDVSDFLDAFQVKIFFTVKYDYWYNLLHELKKRKAKIYVVSALFYPQQSFFTTYGKWLSKQLILTVDWFFHQTLESYLLAQNIGLIKSSVTGDTRFDRVRQIRERNNSVAQIKEFATDHKVVVFGSSWEDEEEIAKIVSKKMQNAKIIIAPHDLKRVEILKEIFSQVVLYSELVSGKIIPDDHKILIIDCIGLLSKLYSYADVAVVGGGFHDAGLHNILEASTFGVPVVFGNRYRKNPEADGLIAAKGGKSFEHHRDASDFILQLLSDDDLIKTMSRNAEDFVSSQPFASELIVDKITSL